MGTIKYAGRQKKNKWDLGEKKGCLSLVLSQTLSYSFVYAFSIVPADQEPETGYKKTEMRLKLKVQIFSHVTQCSAEKHI